MARSRKDKDTSETTANETADADAPKTAADADVEDAVVLEEISADGASGAPSKPEFEETAAVDEAALEAPDGVKRETDEAEPAEAPSGSDDGDDHARAHGDEASGEPVAGDGESQVDNDRAHMASSDSREEPVLSSPPVPAPAGVAEPRVMPFFIAAVAGGIVAALLGFLAARQLDKTEGPTPVENAAAIAALEERLGEVDARIAEIAARDIAAAAAAEVAPVASALTEADARISAVSDRLAELIERVETIAMRPTATGIDADEFDAALGEFREQVNAAIANAQTEIEAARAEAARISEEAFDAEQSSLARAAWGQVTTALESGTTFIEPLTTLEGLTGVEIPPILSERADEGVPTLASLQQSFPDAARAALDAAIRAETGDAPIERLTSFLRVQSGVRSLTPREGDDPDAILSRVEGALRNGDLPEALQELDGLQGPGRDALADWEATARARIAALDAAMAVSSQLNSN